jgi:lipoate-protein ligase B
MGLKIFDLGLIDFKSAWEFQKKVFLDVKNEKFKSALILCQHYPVITLGRQADKKNILLSEAELKKRNINLYKIERGGDVTYHGPGQLVIYPILNLNFFKKDIHLYLRKLEEIALQTIKFFGISGERIPGLTGVWIKNKKIASIGIAVKQWISLHGLSVNIKQADLDNFSLIRPCGMDIMMTSMESVLRREIEIAKVKNILRRRLQNDQSYFA